jgi:AraC-like DNA-binding protein
MAFRPMSGVRAIDTADFDQASAFAAQSFRRGTVKGSSPRSRFIFHRDYFAARDFFAGEVSYGGGWSFEPEEELDAVMIWLGIDGRITVRHANLEATASPKCVLVASARSSRRIVLDDAFHGILLGACTQAVTAEIEGYVGRRVTAPLDFLASLQSDSHAASALVCFGRALHAALGGGLAQNSPIALRRFRDAMIGLTLTSIGKTPMARMVGPPLPGSPANLRLAEDYMRAHADKPIGISDVAAHVGVSTRTLQYMFRQSRGTTPLAALLACRLDGVRRDLVGPNGDAIAQIVGKWGFTHLGRFSRQYQMQFGERASETVRSARLGRLRT